MTRHAFDTLTVPGTVKPLDARIAKLVEGAVGPTPWYWKTFSPLTVDGVAYSWRRADGPVVFLEREETPVLALGFYARPLPASEGHLLVWRPERGTLIASIFELGRLVSLEGLRPSGERPDWGVGSRTDPVDEIEIREGLSGGIHRSQSYCSPLADHDEILLLADGPSGSPAATSIYVWRPRAGEVEVVPQEWFTAEEFDLGYDWITRVVRDPRTGRLAGDGIRISPFLLADDGRTLAK
jgi:hypothetical protein